MRKVLFTEAQMKRILGESYPLSTKGGEVPGNAYGTEVSTNMTNVDADNKPSVTTTDKIAKEKTVGNRWFANSRYGTRAPFIEEGEVDITKSPRTLSNK